MRNLRVALYVASNKNLRFGVVSQDRHRIWVTPVSMELPMKQRQAVTKKKALTYRGADRAGRSRRPQPRWYSFTDGLPEQVLPGRDNRADLGEGGHHPPFPSLLLRHLAPGVSVPLEAFTPAKHWGFDRRRGLLTTTCCASWGHVPLSGCAYSRAACRNRGERCWAPPRSRSDIAHCLCQYLREDDLLPQLRTSAGITGRRPGLRPV